MQQPTKSHNCNLQDGKHTRRQSFVIRIRDEQDRPPRFTSSLSGTIREDAPSVSTLYTQTPSPCSDHLSVNTPFVTGVSGFPLQTPPSLPVCTDSPFLSQAKQRFCTERDSTDDEHCLNLVGWSCAFFFDTSRQLVTFRDSSS